MSFICRAFYNGHYFSGSSFFPVVLNVPTLVEQVRFFASKNTFRFRP